MEIKLLIKKTPKEPVAYLVDGNHRPLWVVYSSYDKLDTLIESLIIKHDIREVNFFENQIDFSLTYYS